MCSSPLVLVLSRKYRREGRPRRHLLMGGARKHTTIPPTILENVPPGAKLGCQEAFGPVVAVYRYRDLEDAIRQVNDTPYGLQAGIFTRDLQHAFRAARQIRTGGVMINEVPTVLMIAIIILVVVKPF